MDDSRVRVADILREAMEEEMRAAIDARMMEVLQAAIPAPDPHQHYWSVASADEVIRNIRRLYEDSRHSSIPMYPRGQGKTFAMQFPAAEVPEPPPVPVPPSARGAMRVSPPKEITGG